MGTLLVALGILLAGGAGALVASSRARLATALGAGGCAAGCAIGFAGALSSLSGPSPALRHRWDVPYGEIALEIDPLTAFFLLIVFGLCLVASIYGAAYLDSTTGRRRIGPHWFFFNLLAASMALVAMARNGVLFLIAWEVMALASFLLVTHEDDHAAVRDAGRLYLIATHAGTAFLLAMFVALSRSTGSMDFDTWRDAASSLPPASAQILFVLGLVGFGTKAGLVPFHVWLPEAHPAAPSHVSAVMSGAMIKMGIYGLLRALTFLGPPPPWWGAALLGLGVASALIGVLYALAQQDIKRLLAYSSVENVGLITIGLGAGAIGLSYDLPVVAFLGFAAALLHALNHAVFKGLLFLAAGAVARETGTRQIDRLGGLIRRMPITGACFLVGAAAIAGLPPFNGFVSEFFLYFVSYRGVIALPGAPGLIPLAGLVGLALASGLAAACFLRLFGVSFLGLPRSGAPEGAREPVAMMRASMITLAATCLLLGLAPALVAPTVQRAVTTLPGLSALPPVIGDSISLTEPFRGYLRVATLLVALAGALAALRWGLLSRRVVARSNTWDCAYENPTSRMQYTASSFAEPLREMFAMLLPVRRRVLLPEGYFPSRAFFRSEIVRPFQERFYWPAFDAVSRGMSRLRWLHHGRVQLYVLYIVVTLILMLAWSLSTVPR